MDVASQPYPEPARSPSILSRSSRVSGESLLQTPSPTDGNYGAPSPPSHRSDAGYGADQPKPRPKPPAATATGPLLRYRRTPFWLTVLYLITLVVPWVLICVLNKRPLSAPSYYSQKGGVSERGYHVFNSVLVFISVLRSINGVLVVPVTSIILAHAVVVYSQRQHHEQKLNIRQLFTLADRGYANVKTMWSCRKEGSSSRLLWLGALLLVLGTLLFSSPPHRIELDSHTSYKGGIQQPFQSALVSFQPTFGVSCTDLPKGDCASSAETAGYDAQPWAMAMASHNLVVEDVANSLVTVSDKVNQEYLWVNDPLAEDVRDYEDTLTRSTLYWYRPDPLSDLKNHPGSAFFVTSLPNGTQTCVLRQQDRKAHV